MCHAEVMKMNDNKMIDHTVLKADATKAMFAKILDEAKE